MFAPLQKKVTGAPALAKQPSSEKAPHLGQRVLLPAEVSQAIREIGQPLERSLRSTMEPQVGGDLTHVRVHTGAGAAESARAVHAAAYTVGPHVVFGAGQYAPATSVGLALIAHELAHVVQQDRGRLSEGRAGLETEADRIASGFGALGGQPADASHARSAFPAALQLLPARCTGVSIDLSGTIEFQGDEGSVSASLSLVGALDPGPYHVTYDTRTNRLRIVPAAKGETLINWTLPSNRSPQERTRLLGYLRSMSGRSVTLMVGAGARAKGVDQAAGRTDGGLGEQGLAGLSLANATTVVSMTEGEYLAMTGLPSAALPEGAFPMGSVFVTSDGKPAPSYLVGRSSLSFGLSKLSSPLSWGPPSPLLDLGTPSRVPSGAAGAFGIGSSFTPLPNYYYRVLTANDPVAAEILRGADLVPITPSGPFQPAASPAEMTFRHLRPGGNVRQIGTDRISTAADLEAFRTTLKNRGTGELVRVDVNVARRLGAQFVENGDIMGHLDQIERQIAQELEAARSAGRGKSAITRLEGRMRALQSARDYARTFKEGEGVQAIPNRAVSQVKGSTLSEAVAGEQAFMRGLRFFRIGGRVILVVGVALSAYRIASAPPQERARVATQEAGGFAFSLAGAALGAKLGAAGGAALGIETGPGAIAFAVLGALVGAAVGFFYGEEVATEAFDTGARAERLLRDTPRLIETTTLMFGSPEDKRKYYELREIETGEPNPFDF